MSRSSFCAVALAVLCAGATQQAAAAYRCDSFAAINGYDSPTALTTAEGSVWYSTPDRLIRVQDRKSQGLVAVDAATKRLSGIALGPDGALWYAKDTSARVGRLPLDGSAGTEFEVSDGKFVRGLHAAADGLWFYDSVKMFVGRIGTDGAIRRYDGPSMNGAPFSPSGLTVGPDGAVWLSVIGHNAVYRLDPASAQFKRFDIGTPNAQPFELLAMPDGRIWVSLQAIRKLGLVMPNGQVVETDIASSTARHLQAGPDGAVWFTDTTASKLGRIGADGSVVTFRCGQNGGPMTIGPDHKLWVIGNGQISIVNDDSVVVKAPVTASGPGLPPPAPRPPEGAPSLPRAGRVEEIAVTALPARLQSSAGRVAVQFTSNDTRCTYCIPATPVFDAEAAKLKPAIGFLRVRFEPWVSVSSTPGSAPYRLTGLPTIVLYEAGQEIARLAGNWDAAQVDAFLQAPAMATTPSPAPPTPTPTPTPPR